MPNLFSSCVLDCLKQEEKSDCVLRCVENENNAYGCLVNVCKEKKNLRRLQTFDINTIVSDIQSTVNELKTDVQSVQTDLDNLGNTLKTDLDNLGNSFITMETNFTSAISGYISDLYSSIQTSFQEAGEEIVYVEGLVINSTQSLYNQIVSSEQRITTYLEYEFVNFTTSVKQDAETEKNQILYYFNLGLFSFIGILSVMFFLFLVFFVVWCIVFQKYKKFCWCCCPKESKGKKSH